MLESSDNKFVADLAEQFVNLHRRGERPQIDDYVRRYPHLEKQIRDLFQTLLVVDDLAPERDVSIAGEEVRPLTTSTNLESLGDFRILGELGRGGMGVVYEAEQVSLGRRVALKVLQHRDLPDTKHRIRFEREARSAARLHHTNIVPVFGVGEEGELSYYVMQLIKGVGLDDLLNQLRRLKRTKTGKHDGMHGVESRPSLHSLDDQQDQLVETVLVGEFAFGQSALSQESPDESVERAIVHNTSDNADSNDRDSSANLLEESTHISGLTGSSVHARQRTYWGSVARIGGQVAEALQYAHEHSILHRDIKPSNLMLDSSGTVWVTDFGLAKATDQQDLTNTGDILGTLRYMPPEAFQGRSDQRSDVYSLGITIYEMLALRPAFDETDRHRLIRQVADKAPDRLEQVDPDIPRDLVTIVHKCIERDPDHRYQTAAELADDFDRFLNDEPIKARRVSSVERLVRWSRRNRGMTAALTTIASLLVLGTVASMILANQFRQQRNQAEYAQYVSDIQAANYHLQNNSTAMAQRILINVPDEYRDWEWMFLANRAWRRNTKQMNSAVLTETNSSAADFWAAGKLFKYPEIVGMSGGILDGQFTSDGGQVLLASSDNALSFYSVATAEPVSALVNSVQGAEMVIGAISQDGNQLVTAALTGPPLVFDLTHPNTPPRTMSLESKTMFVAMDWVWSRDDKHFVSAHFDKTVRIWDAKSMQLVRTIGPLDGEVRHLFIDEQNVLWTASVDGKVIKWSIPSGKRLDEWTYPMTAGLKFLALSLNSNSIIATFQDDSSYLCEIGTDNAVPLSPPIAESQATNANRRRSVVFSPDGTCVAIMRGLFAVAIYDVEKREQLCLIDGHTSPLRSVRFSPDGTKLLATSEEATAVVWSMRPDSGDNSDMLSTAHSDAVYQIDFDNEGRRLISGSFDGTICISDLTTERVISRYTGHDADVVAVDFHPNGRLAASLDRKGQLHVWDTETGESSFQIHPNNDRFLKLMGTTGGGRRGEFFSFPSVLSTGLFSPDGKYLVAFQDDAMKVFDADKDGAVHSRLKGAGEPGWAVFSRDSKLVTAIEMNGSALGIWDVSTGALKHRLEGHQLAVCMASFSPVDDRMVTGGMANCNIWNTRTGKLLQRLEGFAGYTSSCRYSSSGHLVLTGSSDNVCRIWDSESGALITTLQGHTGRIRDVRLSPDETRVVSWATDDQVMVWDTARPTANLLITRTGPSRPLQAHWTTDSKSIVTAWADGSIEIWRGVRKEGLPDFSHDTQVFKKQFDQWREQEFPAEVEDRF